MHTKKFSLVGTPLLLVLSMFAVFMTGTHVASAATTIAQKVGVPSYFIPGTEWASLASSTPSVDFAIANVLNGPDYAADVTYPYSTTLATAHNAGVKVIGYVDTGYFGTTGLATRLGATSTEAWRAQIESDVNAWYAFYGTSTDGIFFDQMQNTCGTSNAYAKLYQQASDYVKFKHPGALTVANPGIAVPQCFQNSADVLLTFEGTYECYAQDASCPSDLRYQAPSWDPTDPHKFYHLIYGTSESNVASTTALSKTRKAGYVYVTSDTLPNPWDTLPSGTYWSTELASVPAGGTVDTTAPTTPGTLDTVEVYFTAVDLDWEKSTDTGGSGVVGYDIYWGTKLLKSVPATSASMQSASIAGLTPNTNYTFTVKARDAAGSVSAASNSLAFTTDVDTDVDFPGKPGRPTSSNVTYTSTNLAWTASTGGDYSVVYYDVVDNGSVILTLPGNVLNTVVGGLTPGSTHSFTIVARDEANNSSAPSTARSVTLLSLPGGSSITNVGGSYSSTTLTYRADVLLPFAFKRVFIDSDNNPSTGFTPYFAASFGSDFMIENGRLYQSTANGASFSFTFLGAATTTVSGYTNTWTLPVSLFGVSPTTTQKFVVQAEGFAPLAYSSVTTLIKN